MSRQRLREGGRPPEAGYDARAIGVDDALTRAAVRIGILGGSFDPPHVGHLMIAIDAIEALSLDRLLLIPANVQPLKASRTPAPADQRIAMLRALIADEPRLEVDTTELGRPGLSYSVDTLAELARRYPDAERHFLIGADVVPTLPRWREPERIAELARIVVLRRGDEAIDASAIPGDPIVLATRRIDVSSTEIRNRVREGKTIRGFVPDAVASVIEAARLYR